MNKILLIICTTLIVASCASSSGDIQNPTTQAQAQTATASTSSTDTQVATVKPKKIRRNTNLTEAVQKRSKRVCRSDPNVTSRIRRKICRTQAEWDYIENETQKRMERLRRENPNGGRGGPGDAVGG